MSPIPDAELTDATVAGRIFALSRDLVCVVGPDGFVHRVNPAFTRTLGWEPDDLQRRLFLDLIHPDDRVATQEALARLGAVGEVEGFENRVSSRDGGYRWLSWAASGPDEQGRVYGVGRDVTDRHRVEAELRESEARYAHIAASVPGMVYQYVFRPDGTRGYTFVSEGVRTLIGVTPDEALRDAAVLLDTIHPDDRPGLRAVALAAAENAPATVRWEGRALLRGGEERVIQVAAFDQRRADGTVLSDGVVLDVTEHRRAEETVRRQAETLRTIFDHMPALVSFIDGAGLRVFANREWQRVSGWSLEESQQMDVFAEMYPEPAERARARELVRAATGEWGDFRMRARDGRIVDMVWACVRLSDGSVVSIGQDVTERRRLEADLRHAQKLEAVGRLAGGVAHDFNNLLTVIQNYGEFLAEALPRDTTLRADLDEILNAASRASDLTRQLLAFGRKQVLQPRIVDVNRKIANVVGMLRRVIGEDITIETRLAERPWPVRADPGQLEQVLMNLAVNARDAMPGGGALRLSTENVTVDDAAARARLGLVPGEYVSLLVEDTGAGIAPAALPHVFEPFFTTKDVGRGTGLGLATVYGIVKQSGGYVYVESAPGRGSRFTVFFPRADAPSEAHPAAGGRALPRGAESILLVEDEAPVRAAARRMLERQGYTVWEAGSVAEALRVASAPGLPIDLLLTDVVMPGESGRVLADELTAARPGLRVLFMSGYTDDEIIRRGLVQPGAVFLEKPFTADSLAHAVRAALEDAEPR